MTEGNKKRPNQTQKTLYGTAESGKMGGTASGVDSGKVKNEAGGRGVYGRQRDAPCDFNKTTQLLVTPAHTHTHTFGFIHTII